jgi:hypothetical protein
MSSGESGCSARGVQARSTWVQHAMSSADAVCAIRHPSSWRPPATRRGTSCTCMALGTSRLGRLVGHGGGRGHGTHAALDCAQRRNLRRGDECARLAGCVPTRIRRAQYEHKLVVCGYDVQACRWRLAGGPCTTTGTRRLGPAHDDSSA